MGNIIAVDKCPSPIENIISFDSNNLPIKEVFPVKSNFQHLSLWSFSEDKESKSSNDKNQFISIPIELSKIEKNHFLLDSENVYILLLIFQKEYETLISQSPFPTGLWGIIESSSNMTPRGLMYAFPATNDSQNLESFLLSKRDYDDSEFKYMLFIWNGKCSSSLLRSYALMKAFDLDKSLSEPKIIPFLFNGYLIKSNEVQMKGIVKFDDIINNSVEGEGSTPNSEKISNFNETVFLLKWLYPEKKKVKKSKILFKGFNINFLKSKKKKNFYNNFKMIDYYISDTVTNGKEDKLKLNIDKKIGIPPKLNLNINEEEKLSDINDYEEEDEDYDDTNFDLNIDYNVSKTSALQMNKSMNIPKLTVSLQQKVFNNEEISKKKANEENELNVIPKITLMQTTDKIISECDKNKLDIDIDNLNEDYNLKDGERKKIINEYYSKHLSEILPNFLYLSGYNAAKNKELLDKYKITHIINCAADFCENVFQNDIKYLSFYLKDHAIENIECIFYECIEFIEKVKQKHERILIQCIQGISRSVSIVIAYLIYINKWTYDQAFNYVQQKRTIAGPNFGFAIQLQNFYLRLFESPDKYRFNPKIFAVGSFQLEQSDKIVCRLINESFFKTKDSKGPRLFDHRGVFLVIGTKKNYIWIGSKVLPSMKDTYIECSEKYIQLLQKYEHASNEKAIYVNEDQEPKEFYIEILKNDPNINKYKNKISGEYSEWNNWYKDSKTKESKNNITNINNNENKSINIINKSFFLYPEYNPDKVLDFDDLNDNLYLIACVKDNEKKEKKVFQWKGNSVELSESECNEYKNKVIEIFYGNDKKDIKYLEEIPMEESEDFVSLL